MNKFFLLPLSWVLLSPYVQAPNLFAEDKTAEESLRKTQQGASNKGSISKQQRVFFQKKIVQKPAFYPLAIQEEKTQELAISESNAYPIESVPEGLPDFSLCDLSTLEYSQQPDASSQPLLEERRGKYFVPSNRIQAVDLNESPALFSAEDSQKHLEDQGESFSFEPSTKKESIDSLVSQEPLNSEETSSAYDSHLSHQNDPSLSEHHPQTTSLQESNDGQEASFNSSSSPNSEEAIGKEKCNTLFHAMHIGLRHTEARGVGYHDGYTTLEAFGIAPHASLFMPFVDLRWHAFDNGKFAGNVGIGARSFLPSCDHVLGYYLYYDVRQDDHHLNPQQLGPGIELLGKRMEYRLNGYVPVGRHKSHRYGLDFDRFKGHHILLKAHQRQLMAGGDAEVGAHLTQSSEYDVYTGAGPYYFSSSQASAWGGKVRLLGRFRQYVSLEAAYSYDHLFGSVIQGTVAIHLPFGRILKRSSSQCSSQVNLALSRAAFSPYRFEIPIVKRVTRKEKALNPATNNPWRVWFVNNTSHSNGTFNSPFPTLIQAQNASQPYDMIYVFSGDGTTTGMDGGIILQDHQKFFGSGRSHRIKTTKGKVKIPAFSKELPLITNTGGNVVTLANGNEVSAFNVRITQNGGKGIDGVNIRGATITHNFINSGFVNSSGGIRVIGDGMVRIMDNDCRTEISSNSDRGIDVEILDGQFMQTMIANNVISGYEDGIFFSPLINPSSASAEVLISGNSISDFLNHGITYYSGMPNSMVTISNNTVINNNGAPMGIIGTDYGGITVSVNKAPDSGTVIIKNNRVFTTTSNIQQYGITAQVNSSTGAHFNAFLTNNVITTGSGAQSVGLNVFVGPNQTICTSIENNRITQQASSGTNDISITTDANGIVNIDNFSGNIGSNVRIQGNVNFVPEGSCQ